MKNTKLKASVKDKELEKFTKIIKGAYKTAEDFAKRDLKSSSNLNFKFC